MITELRRAAPEGYGQLVGVGLAVPGIPDRSGSHVSFAPSLDWNDAPVGNTMRERFNTATLVQNDVDAMLLGEQWRGAATGVSHAVAVYVGAGVGAAALLDGQLYRGRDGAVGEIGYWISDPSDEPRQIGYGHFESRISTSALARRWAAEVGWQGQTPSPGAASGGEKQAASGTADAFTALVERAEAGDPATLAMVAETAKLIGLVVVNLVTFLNPEVAILGGEILRLGRFVLPVVSEMVNDHTPFPARVVPAALGDRSTLIGTVYGVLRQNRSSVSYME